MLFRTNRAFVIALVLAGGLVSTACSQTNPIEGTRSTSQHIAGGGATQDWSLLGGGQCLVAMQNFYPKKFGARVPSARASRTGDCLGEGACHIWLDDIPSSDAWERIPNDGSRKPAPYDLIVYPPSKSNGYGHIASVDHVGDDGTIWIMDSNWNLDEKKSAAPHTSGSYVAYGWYHLRSLGSGGGGGASDPGNAPEPNAQANTCGNYAKRNGFTDARCEWNGNGACGGIGPSTDDCAHCCDAANPSPSSTTMSCGELARAQKWGDGALCEWNQNGACGGNGPATSDCDHCCVP